MDKLPRADLGALQGQEPERGEEDEMTFEDFLNGCLEEMEELAEIDKDLPFTDD